MYLDGHNPDGFLEMSVSDCFNVKEGRAVRDKNKKEGWKEYVWRAEEDEVEKEDT